MTEQNILDVEGYRMKNKWKELYSSTKQEMDARTEKFDKSISVFCYILKDMKKVIHDHRLLAEEKLIIS